MIEKGSRHINLGWTTSQDGNSPITQYIIEYKTESGEHVERIYCLLRFNIVFNMKNVNIKKGRILKINKFIMEIKNGLIKNLTCN